jgi:hypothetical protein
VLLFVALFAQSSIPSAHATSLVVKPKHSTSAHPSNLGSGCSNTYCFVNPVLQDWCSTGWNGLVSVEYGETYYYTTAMGSRFCDQATWYGTSYTRTHTCSVYVFIPEAFATGSVAYGIFNASGSRIATSVLDQNNYNGWVFLGSGASWYGIDHVQFSNDTGQTDEYLAAGRVEFLCN